MTCDDWRWGGIQPFLNNSVASCFFCVVLAVESKSLYMPEVILSSRRTPQNIVADKRIVEV